MKSDMKDNPGRLTVSPAQLKLETSGSTDREKWGAFVRSHPEATLCHAYEWKTVIEKTYAKTCPYLSVMRDDECEGVLPLVHMKGPLTGNRLVSVPFLDQGGLLASAEKVAEMLWNGCLDLARQVGADGIDFRGPSGGTAAAGSKAADRCARVTLTLPLPAETEALWKSFRPKVRNQVRKAEKEGLRTEIAEPDRLNAFYEVFCRNMRDLGSPVHARLLFETVFETFGDDAQLYLTKDRNERVVGGAIAIESGVTVTVPWASSLRESFRSCPNHSLYWKILSDAARRGAKLFDFGRSRVDSGTYSFKKQWGAEPHELVWSSFDPRGNPQEERVFNSDGHARIARAWKRLPLGLTKFIGPFIRRQLSL